MNLSHYNFFLKLFFKYLFLFLKLYFSNICNSFLIENKYAPCISDNTDLRVILSILYTLLEVTRCYDIEVAAKRLKSNSDQEAKIKKFKEHLISELSNYYFVLLKVWNLNSNMLFFSFLKRQAIRQDKWIAFGLFVSTDK